MHLGVAPKRWWVPLFMFIFLNFVAFSSFSLFVTKKFVEKLKKIIRPPANSVQSNRSLVKIHNNTLSTIGLAQCLTKEKWLVTPKEGQFKKYEWK